MIYDFSIYISTCESKRTVTQDLRHSESGYSKTIFPSKDGNKWNSVLYARDGAQREQYRRYDIVATSLGTAHCWNPNLKERTREIGKIQAYTTSSPRWRQV